MYSQTLHPLCANRADLVGFLRIMDMEMMMTYNGVERDLEGWKALFVSADRRLKLQNVATPPGSAHSIMELVLDPTTNGE